MANIALIILKKTYKILIVVGVAVVFFFFYNTYMVDHSLSNLRLALDRVGDIKTLDDAKKLSKMLDSALLNEIASSKLEASSLAKLQLAKEILSQPVNKTQLEQVKQALQEIVQEKESKRATVLVTLDKINKVFESAEPKAQEIQEEAQVKKLKNQLSIAVEKNQRRQVYFELGNTYTKLSRLKEAKSAYLQVIELEKGDQLAEQVKFNLAWNEKKEGNIKEAIGYFKDVIQVTQDQKLAGLCKYQLAELYRQNGEFEKAVTAYKEVASSPQNNELSQAASMQVGYTYLNDIKDFDLAKKAFDQTLLQAKESKGAQSVTTALSGMAGQYRKLGLSLLAENRRNQEQEKYQEALSNFNRALEADPKDGISYIGSALAYLWLKNSEKAIELAREAIKYSPKNELVSTDFVYILIKLNLYNEAVKEHKRYVSENPFSARTYYNAGYCYVMLGKLQDAANAFEQAQKIEPRFYRAYNNRGWCLWQLGDYSKATEEFEQAVKLKADFLEARYNLGMVYKTIGKFKEAHENLSAVAAINPDYGQVKKALQEIDQFIL